MSRRPQQSIVANPVLVGAVTVLVAIIAVFLAYNANSGLPFVPTYDIKAEIPGGSNLVKGNEVRMGGFRIGSVERILPAVAEPGERARAQEGEQRAISVVELKLDERVNPLAKDVRVQIRPRSALGLKYVALTPGRSEAKLGPGDTIPLAQSMKPIELDEFFGIQNDDFRRNTRTVLEGYGTALSGRGVGINETIRDARPLFEKVEPVFRNLSSEATELDNFFLQAGRTSAQIAPVAETYGRLFKNLGTTFEALTREPESLRDTIEGLRPTLDAGISSFKVQRPFLRDTAELSRRLRPVAVEIERSLPVVADAFEVGAPVQGRVPTLYRHTSNVFSALDELASNPSTLMGLRELRRTLEVATPLVEYVAPYQTVCNYMTYWLTGLSEHVSELVPGGTGQRSSSIGGNSTQDNRINSSDADRPVDVPAGQDPRTATDPRGDPLQALHGGAYGAAIDAQGNADCEVGQRGYAIGPSVQDGRYAPSPDPTQGGGSHVVLGLPPGLSGGTYKSRELGIDNLEDVP